MSKKDMKSSYPKDPSYIYPPPMSMPQYNAAPSAPMYQAGAPPPYSQYPQAAYSAGVPGPPQPYPTNNPNMMVAGYPGTSSMGGYPPQGTPPMGYPHQGHQPPPQTGYYNPEYMGQSPYQMAAPVAQFDAGARFDGISSHNVPPPPPGVAPNAAQRAMAYGAPVATTQKQSNWLTGGSGGGMSFW